MAFLLARGFMCVGERERRGLHNTVGIGYNLKVFSADVDSVFKGPAYTLV